MELEDSLSDQSFDESVSGDDLWLELRQDAYKMIEREPCLSHLVEDRILKHSTFAHALAFSLASKMHCSLMPVEALQSIFLEAFNTQVPGQDDLETLAVIDLSVIRERDPACESLLAAFLYFKGYKSLQAYRVSNLYFKLGRKNLAFMIQSRCAEVFGIDIHPEATIGSGLMIDHGNGVVICGSSTIGKNCSILHGVTIGALLNAPGQKHPKVGNDALIGCNACVLGSIDVGNNCNIGAGSIILKALPNSVTAVGNPARIVGRPKSSRCGKLMDQRLENVEGTNGLPFLESWNV